MVATQPHQLLKQVSGTKGVVTPECIVQEEGQKQQQQQQQPQNRLN
jgi:hypothetical protein